MLYRFLGTALIVLVLFSFNAIAQERITNKEEVNAAIKRANIPKPIIPVEQSNRHVIDVEYDEFEDTTRISSRFNIGTQKGREFLFSIVISVSVTGKIPIADKDVSISLYPIFALEDHRHLEANRVFWIVDNTRFEMLSYEENGINNTQLSSTGLYIHYPLISINSSIAEFIARSESARLRYVGHEYKLTDKDKATLLEVIRMIRSK